VLATAVQRNLLVSPCCSDPTNPTNSNPSIHPSIHHPSTTIELVLVGDRLIINHIVSIFVVIGLVLLIHINTNRENARGRGGVNVVEASVGRYLDGLQNLSISSQPLVLVHVSGGGALDQPPARHEGREQPPAKRHCRSRLGAAERLGGHGLRERPDRYRPLDCAGSPWSCGARKVELGGLGGPHGDLRVVNDPRDLAPTQRNQQRSRWRGVGARRWRQACGSTKRRRWHCGEVLGGIAVARQRIGEQLKDRHSILVGPASKQQANAGSVIPSHPPPPGLDSKTYAPHEQGIVARECEHKLIDVRTLADRERHDGAYRSRGGR